MGKSCSIGWEWSQADGGELHGDKQGRDSQSVPVSFVLL